MAEPLLPLPASFGDSVSRSSNAGFTLIDTMITLLIFGILSATAAPVFMDMTKSMRLGQAIRDVERELQTARLKAVTSNQPIRVRFNCPAAGQFRMVEVIGTPTVPVSTDALTNAGRCSEAAYPFPATDDNPLTRPNHDGPLRRLHETLSFGSNAAIEFWPDGSAHRQTGSENPWSVAPTTGVNLTVTDGTNTRTVQVNSLGKIRIVQ